MLLSKLTRSLLLRQLQYKMLLLMMCSERCHLEQEPRGEKRLCNEKQTVSKTSSDKSTQSKSLKMLKNSQNI